MSSEESNSSHFEQRLSELEKRYDLDTKNVSKDAGSKVSNPSKIMNTAFQILSEMFAGIAVGAVIGYGLGILLGGKVIFLVLGVILGFSAGILNVMRVINRTTF